MNFSNAKLDALVFANEVHMCTENREHTNIQSKTETYRIIFFILTNNVIN